ncbi:MAG TPA: MG2 domain-containing protein [Myxococcota bacterium]|nr:MG2 domain-containing protein [Myxococcota bacterium]
MRKKVIIPCQVAAVLVALLGMSSAAGALQPRFYLSTERVFSPEESDIHVRLEARSLPYVDFRLYRVTDPLKFFGHQDNLHRIEMKNAPARMNSLDVLGGLWRDGLQAGIRQMREGFSDKARAAGRDAFGGQLQDLQESIAPASAMTTVVPFIKDLDLADSWREEIPPGSPEWAYLDVKINTHEPGVYLVQGIHGNEIGYTMVIISRMIVLTRQSPDKILVYAVDPDLGSPVEDAAIVVNNGDNEIGRGKTGSDGLWSKDIPLERSLVVLVTRGRDFALADPTYHPAGLFGRKVYLTTERPVYRPGQAVFFKGVVRDYVDERYRIDPGLKLATVSVRDPNGQEIYTDSLAIGKSGSFDGRFDIFDNAAKGTYQLISEVGGKEYGGEFKVKAYRKPEYRVKLSTPRKAYKSGEKVSARVTANYYFGPPVPRAKVKLSVFRTRFYIPWWIDADYSWYYSDAEYQSTIRETIIEKEGRLDKDGRFEFDFETLPESLDYTYGIEAIVTDASNQAVSGHGSVRVTRAKFRLALEPRQLLFSPGQQARIRLSSTDYDKNPVAADVDVEVTATLGAEPSKATSERILSRRISTGPKGENVILFTPAKGGSYKVTAKAADAQGQRVECSTTLYVTSNGGDIPYSPDELRIIADRRSYGIGDKARFLVLTPHADANLLFTVEGGRLYRAEAAPARGFSRVFEVKIAEAQTPNFTVRLATVFDHTLYERRLDVVVPPRRKLLSVAVHAERQFAEPGDEIGFEVRVTDNLGHPVAGAEVALGIVDEAIYGISPELAVPISQFFYHRKRNNVRALCSADFRFYGYGQDSRDRMAALTLRSPVVPGSFKNLAANQVRRDFKDTLAWYPHLVTNAEGKARTKLKAPDNLTTWRASARVITADTRVGQGAGKMQVTKPVVARLAAPTFLVEHDLATIGVLVHNYTDKTRTFTTSLQTDGHKLRISGEPVKLEVKPRGVGLASFQAQAQESGTAVLRASAVSDGASDSLERKIPLRPYGMQQHLLAGGTLDDQTPETSITLTVPDAARPKSASTTVTLSSGIAPALLDSLRYLAGYPYGCTEQTMNRFLPDLVVARALQELGMKNKRLEDELPRFIHAGLAHLGQLQHQDGGWGWWSDDSTDAFMTAYVVSGLALAKSLKWPVDADMLDRGTNRLKALVKSPQLNANQRSYLLYSLALAGVKYGSMVEKVAGDKNLSVYGQALSAMALLEMGKQESAVALTGRIDLAVNKSANGAWWGDDRGGPGWESDPVETTAAALRALVTLKPGSLNIGQAVRWLMSVRQGDRWHSTRDTAMVVFSLVDYLKKQGAAEYLARVDLVLNDQQRAKKDFGPEDVFKPSVTLLRDAPARIGKNLVHISRQGKGVLFYNVAINYFGRQEQITAQGERLRIRRSMFALDKTLVGESWRFRTKPLAGKASPGDELLVVLEIAAAQNTDYVMIEDPLPAGVQPIESDHGYALPGYELRQPGLHREISDQHVAFFISRLKKGRRKIAYLVRAAVPGVFRVMPARVLPMYDPQFGGNSASGIVQIED